MLEHDLIAQRPMQVRVAVRDEVVGNLVRDSQVTLLFRDARAALLQHLEEELHVVSFLDGLDLVEREPKDAQLLNHVDRCALPQVVVTVARFLVRTRRLEDPLHMVEAQRFLGHAVQFRHATDGQFVHSTPSSCTT